MKFLLPLLAVPFLLTACSTAPRTVWADEPLSRRSDPYSARWSDVNATRFDLYSPTQPSGPYTTALKSGSWKNAGIRVDEEMAIREEQQRVQEATARPVPKPQ